MYARTRLAKLRYLPLLCPEHCENYARSAPDVTPGIRALCPVSFFQTEAMHDAMSLGFQHRLGDLDSARDYNYLHVGAYGSKCQMLHRVVVRVLLVHRACKPNPGGDIMQLISSLVDA
eukprot:COSAG02_NODE_1158_length_14185_cov_21.954778_5_plen_118_part_00